MHKQAAHNCRVVRACRRICELYQKLGNFPFHRAGCNVCAGMSMLHCQGTGQLLHARGRVSADVEDDVKQLFRCAVECMRLAAELCKASDTVAAGHVNSNAEKIAAYASQLSALYQSLRKFDAQLGSTPQSQREGKKRQVQSARADLEGAVSTIVASGMFINPTVHAPGEEERLDGMLTALVQAVLVCDAELSAERSEFLSSRSRRTQWL